MWWTEHIYAIAFYLAAAVAVLSALMVVGHRHPVINALYLVVCFFAVAVCYVLLQAHFLAAVQILLYAGAVLVLFLMIVMLMDLDPRQLGLSRPGPDKFIAGAAVFGFALIAVWVVLGFRWINEPRRATPAELAQFLLQRGVPRSQVMDQAPPDNAAKKEEEGGPARLLSEEEMAAVALDALKAYEEEQWKGWYELPPAFKELDREELEKVNSSLLGQIDRTKKLSGLKPPSELSRLRSSDLEEYVEAVVKGRLRKLREFGTAAAVGRVLFSRYLLPFEAAGVLLLAAIVGVMSLARRSPEQEEK